MFKKVFAIIPVLVVALTTTLAQPPGGPPQRMKDRPGQEEGFIKKLNLNESQELQMAKLRLELMKKQTQLHSKIQTLRLDTKELFLAEKVDKSAIEKNIKGVSDAEEQIKLNFLDHWFVVNGILTADQQKIWRKAPMEFEKQMRERGREMMGGHEGHPDFY